MASAYNNDLLRAAVMYGKKYGVPPELLIATTLVESGGRLDAVGDNGRSHGPYQEYDMGRGYKIPIAGRRDPYASSNRAARDFAKYKTGDFGVWAARAQRPADPRGYARKINAALARARAILGGNAGIANDPSLLNAPITATGEAPVTGAMEGFNSSGNMLELARAAMGNRRQGESLTSAVRRSMSMQRLAPGYGETPASPAAPTSGGHQTLEYHVPGGVTVPRNDGSYSWANQLANKYGLRVSSTYRDPAHNRRIGGSPTSAHMRRGAAADFAGSPASMRAFADWAMKSGKFKEVFYDPIGQWDNGRRSNRGIGGHSDHVHVTY